MVSSCVHGQIQSIQARAADEGGGGEIRHCVNSSLIAQTRTKVD